MQLVGVWYRGFCTRLFPALEMRKEMFGSVLSMSNLEVVVALRFVGERMSGLVRSDLAELSCG